VSRAEERLRQRDRELEEYSQRIAHHEAKAEHLLEEMDSLRREYSLAADEQSKALQDVSLREGEARSQMEALIRQKAETDIEIENLTDKVVALQHEVERLRRQVHELQQESADKEVKIVQLTKQRAQDKEDLQGINIALDSKQQELELVRNFSKLSGADAYTFV
jgi:chromosome segregation ATPase